MNSGASKVIFAVLVVLLQLIATLGAQAQSDNVTLSGTVTGVAGKPIPRAKVSAKNVSTGQTAEGHSDTTGSDSLSNLAAGDFEIVAIADGFTTSNATVISLAPGSQQTANFVLTRNESAQGVTPASPPPSANSADSLPNAPSSSQTAPSLSDLGFSVAETQADARRQALLDKRTHMLKIHQRMGLITTGPLIATVIASLYAGGKNTSSTSRDLHVALGSLTGDLYGITAYYAIRAPRIPGTETRGPIHAHKILAWIHGPGMIATPILGAMAFSQKNNGEKVHGIAQAHGPVAIVTAGAFGAALLSVSVKF